MRIQLIRALALASALCVLLSGCGVGTEADGAGDRKTPTNRTPTDRAVPEAGTDRGDAETADSPSLGTPPSRRQGSFYAGTTVVFRDRAYTSFGDGIYCLPTAAHDSAPAHVVTDSLIYDTSLCTDGYTVYYISASGELVEANAEGPASSRIPPLRQVTTDRAYPFQTGVIGAGTDRVYVQVPGQYDPASDEPGELDSVEAVSLETGEVLERYEWFGGSGCAGGCTAIYAEGYDVSPRQLYIFDAAGRIVVDEPYAMNASASGGTLWYSASEQRPDGGQGPMVLYRLDPSGPVEVLRDQHPDTWFSYGYSVRGFLAFLYYTDGDGNFETETWDLRTLEKVSMLDNAFYAESWILDGAAYVTTASQVCRLAEDRVTPVFSCPVELAGNTLSLSGNTILLDCSGGEFYTFPLDPDNTVHPLSVTAATGVLEEYDGRYGATVLGYYPILMEEQYAAPDGLAQALAAYNQAAMERTRENAADCAVFASYQIENGFAAPETPFSASTRAYIQRADTLAFCFVEHQTMDNQVNRGLLDTRTGYNFDAIDGHPLTLEEVVKDRDSLTAVLAEQLEETGLADRADLEEFLRDWADAAADGTSTPAFSWVLGYEGVSFYFNGNINFPYGHTAVKCVLPFSSYPDLFQEKYFATPDSYAYDILLDDFFQEPYWVEDSSGTHVLYPVLTREAGTDMGQLSVTRDGVTGTIPFYGFPVYGTILHQGGSADGDGPRTGGSNYLAVQFGGDGMSLCFYALDSGIRQVLDFGPGALPQHIPVDNRYGYDSMAPVHSWLGNPACFAILHDDGIGGYTNRQFHQFRDGMLADLDLFGASQAVG